MKCMFGIKKNTHTICVCMYVCTASGAQPTRFDPSGKGTDKEDAHRGERGGRATTQDPYIRNLGESDHQGTGGP